MQSRRRQARKLLTAARGRGARRRDDRARPGGSEHERTPHPAAGRRHHRHPDRRPRAAPSRSDQGLVHRREHRLRKRRLTSRGDPLQHHRPPGTEIPMLTNSHPLHRLAIVAAAVLTAALAAAAPVASAQDDTARQSPLPPAACATHGTVGLAYQAGVNCRLVRGRRPPAAVHRLRAASAACHRPPRAGRVHVPRQHRHR